MLKPLLLAVAVAAHATLLCAPASAQNADAALDERLRAGVLRWGGDAEGGAPYQLLDPQQPDRVTGFEVELVEALAERISERLGRTIRAEFVQYDWGSLIPGLVATRDFDLIASGLEITPETSAKVRFSRPYYAFRQELTVRADDEQIHSLADLVDRPVGTMAVTAAYRLLERSGVRQIAAFDGQVEAYLDLELGRVDAVLLDAPIAIYFGRTNPRLKSLGAVGDLGYYGLAVRPDDPVLAEALDRALAEVIRSGRLAEILARWWMWNADQATLAQPPDRTEELAGLGFNADGTPTAGGPRETRPRVDREQIAASHRRWTPSDYGPLLLKSAGMTVFLSVTSMALAMALGLVVAVAGLYGPAPVRWLSIAYVEFFRGVPLLLLLWVLYFSLPHIGIKLPAVATAIIGCGLNYAAYEAQIYRTSLVNVPRGQWEAGRSLGMNDATVFHRIILPQAFRLAAGPMTNDFVALFKETSLVSVIAVVELTKQYLILAKSSNMYFEIGMVTALLYLMMSIPLGYLSRSLESRWHAGARV